MPRPPRTAATANDFPGMFGNFDPRDIPDGAAEEQINLVCIVIGEIRSRLGIIEVEFDDE